MRKLATARSVLILVTAVLSAACEEKGLELTAVLDRSDSMEDGCSRLIAVVDKHLPTGQRTSLTVLGTGDRDSADEPILIFAVELGRSRRVLEGKKGDAARRKQLLRDMQAACVSAGTAKRSPVLLALVRAVHHMRSRKCGGENRCEVVVISDGEESVDKRLQRGAKLLKEPAADNNNVGVTFYGFAQTKGQLDGGRASTRNRTPRDAKWLEDIWRSTCSDPGRVSFEPIAPSIDETMRRELDSMRADRSRI